MQELEKVADLLETLRLHFDEYFLGIIMVCVSSKKVDMEIQNANLSSADLRTLWTPFFRPEFKNCNLIVAL